MLWFTDTRNPRQEVTAFSSIPGRSYGIVKEPGNQDRGPVWILSIHDFDWLSTEPCDSKEDAMDRAEAHELAAKRIRA